MHYVESWLHHSLRAQAALSLSYGASRQHSHMATHTHRLSIPTAQVLHFPLIPCVHSTANRQPRDCCCVPEVIPGRPTYRSLYGEGQQQDPALLFR